MGLDQYAYSVPKGTDITQTKDATQVYYWRKHPGLQGWMQRLYTEKGGEKEFNCEFVALTLRDLLRLRKDIEQDLLPKTQGFFFGSTTGEEKAMDMEFIAKAISEISEDREVYYYSWW